MKTHSTLLLNLSFGLSLLFSASLSLSGQKPHAGQESHTVHETLEFNEQGRFRIAQFTDLHYYPGGAKSQAVIENLHAVLQAETPQLVVLTGDVVTCSGPLCPTYEAWDSLAQVFNRYQVPWIVTFGNHDDEAQVTREELLEYLSSKPGCLLSAALHQTAGSDEQTRKDDQTGQGLLALRNDDVPAGVGNQVIPVMNREGQAEKLLYFLDSHAYSTEKKKGVKGYGWLDRSQVNWFASTNERWLEEQPDIGALVFYHIPIPEYREAFDHGSFRLGVREEKECAPEINTGFFAEQLIQGNVTGNFVGHDHDNNYVAQRYGIPLCYGAFSGGNSYFNLRMNGARIIELSQGKERYSTWLRYRDGVVENQVVLPVR